MIPSPQGKPRWHPPGMVLQLSLFLAALLASMAASELVAQGTPVALVFALLPIPCLAWLFLAFVNSVRSMDELERRIQLEALAVAFPCAVLIVFSAGVLDRAGFDGEHDWDLPRLWPLLLPPYFFGLWRARRRYQ